MKTLLFLGSTRQSHPPSPPRLGQRVAHALLRLLQRDYPDDTVELVDPLDYDCDTVFKPHFAYPASRTPETLDQLAESIHDADAYVMISPEYNHSFSPALAHMLNHFGSSLFAYKPSLITTYSAGQWGGTRAAVGLRTFLSELGCLPVSAMIHIPQATEVLNEKGHYQDGQNGSRWDDYLQRGTTQLHWWAQAAHAHRRQIDPHALIGDFTRSPKQRNAPG